MDPAGNGEIKKQPEVVLVIPADSSVVKPIKFPEISMLGRSLSLLLPPRLQHSDTLCRGPMISVAPSFPKPKSRFVEKLPPAAPDIKAYEFPFSSSFQKTPELCTSRTQLATAVEDDEEDVCQSQRPKRWTCCRIMALIEWGTLVLTVGCLVTSLTVPGYQSFVFWGLEIWRWCLMVAVTCCGRLVSHWFINILVFLIERNFLLRMEVLYYVYGLKKSVQVCIWLGLVLFAWSRVFTHVVHRSPETVKILDYITGILASLLIGSVIWLVKTLLVKILASSFHMNRFFDRIQESLFHQYVLTLLGPPAMKLPETRPAKRIRRMSIRTGKGKDKINGGEELGGIDVKKLHKMMQEEVSAWRMKGLISAVRSSGLMTNMMEQSYDGRNEQGEWEITSELEAKFVASQIFENVAKPGYKYIEEEDLSRFLTKKEVDNVLQLLQGAGKTRKIDESDLKNWVVKAYIDRVSLAHSLNDTKSAVNQLHKLATIAVIIAIIVITLLLMGFATTQVLVLISSQILLVAFMFGNTCRTAFESIIFVFVMHPFDVGDRCVIDGMQVIVEEMNILTTVFLGNDNEKICYPNSVLVTKPITNFYRSPEMGDSVLLSADVTTSLEFVGALKARIKLYIDSKPNHWRPTHSIVLKDIVDAKKMNMVLYVSHTMNYQNIEEKNSRRSDLVLELKKIFEELSIQNNLLPGEANSK